MQKSIASPFLFQEKNTFFFYMFQKIFFHQTNSTCTQKKSGGRWVEVDEKHLSLETSIL